MSGPVRFKVVNDELRKAATNGRWTELLTQVSIGRTVAIEPEEARAAANALTTAMRAKGLKLHRKTMIVDGTKSTVFWADRALGTS